MVHTLEDLAEGAFTHNFLNFVAVSNVVLHSSEVLTILGIEPVIVGIFLLGLLKRFLVAFLQGALLIHIVDRLVLTNFS